MMRVLFLGFALLTAACGGKSFESLCASQVPPPAACNTACDPSPGAADACPAGFHCTSDGKCDTFCTQGGNECGNGYTCTADGRCDPRGNGSGSGSDMEPDACPSVHFTATKVTPSIQLLIDRSGSMLDAFGATQKYLAVQDALIGSQGVVTQLASQVYFGASMYPSNACPAILELGRGLNNKDAITTFLKANPPAQPGEGVRFTPTPPSIDAVVADFKANPPPQGSPPVIVLATDGLPNTCDSTTDRQAESVAAAASAYANGIKLYILSVGTIQDAATHLQAMANAGQGVQGGQPDAPVFVGDNPTELAAAFQTIIRGVVSCDLMLNGHIDPGSGASGTVTLNGAPLTFDTDWKLDMDGITIHLIGKACDTLKMSPDPKVDATFSCGAVIF